MNVLPVKKSIPEENLNKYVIMIHGRPKVGKTTLAAQFDDPLFLMFEPGAKALSLYKVEITSWKKFKEINQELRQSEDGKRFKTVVFDTLAIAYKLCSDYICNEMGVDHPSDGKWGKVWEGVETEFNSEMNKLSLSGKGIILLAHTGKDDVEQPDGTVKEMFSPDISKAAMRFVNRCVDLCAYYFYGKNGERWIRIQATDNIVAGNRINGHFVGINKFRAGDSAESAYTNFIAAFQNKSVKENQNGSTRQTINSGKSKGLLFDKPR